MKNETLDLKKPDTTLRWYVMRSVSGKETKVKEYIDAEIARGDFRGLVDEVLVPMEKVVVMRGNKRAVKDRVHMPGYVLVHAALVGEIQQTLRNTPNVLGFLSDTKGEKAKPAPILEHEMRRLLGEVDEMALVPEEIEIPYLLGEQVKVCDGPFTGFAGEIENVDSEKKKLTVTVNIFGRSTPLELNYSQVERV